MIILYLYYHSKTCTNAIAKCLELLQILESLDSMDNRKVNLQETPAAGWHHLINTRNYVWGSLSTLHGPVQAKDNTVLWMDMTRGYQLQQKGEANSILHKLCDTWRQIAPFGEKKKTLCVMLHGV